MLVVFLQHPEEANVNTLERSMAISRVHLCPTDNSHEIKAGKVHEVFQA